ncbi:hypothetical protein SynA1560_00881 [Synechococcus sp. A15-60]|nr:hypothetical protein SynA1560_00881 [Synechococcus sp. A15-60]
MFIRRPHAVTCSLSVANVVFAGWMSIASMHGSPLRCQPNWQ